MLKHLESIEELTKKFPHRYTRPKIHPSVFLADGSHVYGDVSIGEGSSVWFNTVLRGDVNYIRIGERTNIQDLSVVHVSYETHPTILGDEVTVGHSVILHACKIGNRVLIGMGSVVLDGAEIEDEVLLGAGSLVTQNMKIPSGKRAFGRPAKIVGDLAPQEREYLRWSAQHYVDLSKTYR